MVDILSLVNSGGQVKLEVTAGDLQHFGEMLIRQARKEWEEERALAHEEEPEEKLLSTNEVCNIFGVCPATLWLWHRSGYLRHKKIGNRNKYPESAVKALRQTRSLNVTVSGYCKQKSMEEEGGVAV